MLVMIHLGRQVQHEECQKFQNLMKNKRKKKLCVTFTLYICTCKGLKSTAYIVGRQAKVSHENRKRYLIRISNKTYIQGNTLMPYVKAPMS